MDSENNFVVFVLIFIAFIAMAGYIVDFDSLTEQQSIQQQTQLEEQNQEQVNEKLMDELEEPTKEQADEEPVDAVKQEKNQKNFGSYSGPTERDSSTPFFGIEEDFNKENDVASLSLDDFIDLRVKIARTHGGPFVWDNVEPEKGEFDFSITDKAVSDASDAGILIFASLWSYALWDQGHLSECMVGGEIDAVRERVIDYRCIPQDMNAHNNFVKELVERYDGDEDFGSYPLTEELKEKIRKNPVIYYEINNEVDAGNNIDTAKFFQGTIPEYVELLKNSYSSIKEVCSHCIVAVAAPAGETQEFYSEIFSLGAKNYFDMYNLHTIVDELTEVIVEIDKPVFISESIVREDTESIKELFYFALDGADLMIVNMAPDKFKYETKGIIEGTQREEEFLEEFLINKEGERNNVFFVIKNLATELEYFTEIELIETQAGITEFKFSFEEKKPVYVFFSEETGTQVFSPELNDFTVKDMYGNEIEVTNNSFELEEENIYFVKEN
jgi:hypothetical protein